jgi:hypothetical protein
MSGSLRLNLGCGYNHIQGCVNVDRFSGCQPDLVVDLEAFPWPWGDCSVAEINLIHSLEHLGQETATYLQLFQEMWRVCEDGALVHIVVPHPRHDSFLNDPTHVRVVTPDGLLMFCQATNQKWIEMGASNTPLGLQLGIDFQTIQFNYDLDGFWKEKVQSGEITQEQLLFAGHSQNNVFSSIAITLQAVKPAGRLTV